MKPLNKLLKSVIKPIVKPIVNDIKGSVGEHKVSSKLNPLIFGKVEHRQINDLTIVDENGQSHQIDHVEIRQNGIFCIETKNYSGWIFGNESQQMWTQTLYNEKHQFLNPIKQNRTHIYHLNRVLENKYKINSVIVMVQNNADEIGVPYVVNLSDLKNYLSNFNDGTNYSVEEMDLIYHKLASAADRNITKKEHIANIHTTQSNIENNICPKCKSKLVLKEGQYGQFYGCPNYPNCRFTKKI